VFKMKSNFKRFESQMKGIKKKLDAVQELVLVRSAEYLRDSVVEGLPSKFEELRSGLRVGRVQGTTAFGVYYVGQTVTKKPKDIEPSTEVLYVRPLKGRLVRVSDRVRVLVLYSPWPVDLLPFFPGRREAVVVSRRVTEDEVASVRKQREDDRSRWEHELVSLGVKVGEPLKVPLRSKVVEDVPFQALRLEFGGEGVAARPVWRPTLRNLVKSRLSGIFQRALKDVFDGGAEPKAEVSITNGKLADCAGFQERVLK